MAFMYVYIDTHDAEATGQCPASASVTLRQGLSWNQGRICLDWLTELQVFSCLSFPGLRS